MSHPPPGVWAGTRSQCSHLLFPRPRGPFSLSLHGGDPRTQSPTCRWGRSMGISLDVPSAAEALGESCMGGFSQNAPFQQHGQYGPASVAERAQTELAAGSGGSAWSRLGAQGEAALKAGCMGQWGAPGRGCNSLWPCLYEPHPQLPLLQRSPGLG